MAPMHMIAQAGGASGATLPRRRRQCHYRSRVRSARFHQLATTTQVPVARTRTRTRTRVRLANERLWRWRRPPAALEPHLPPPTRARTPPASTWHTTASATCAAAHSSSLFTSPLLSSSEHKCLCSPGLRVANALVLSVARRVPISGFYEYEYEQHARKSRAARELSIRRQSAY